MTETRTKIAEWLTRHQHKQKWLAAQIGVTKQSVSDWCSGKKYPDPGRAHAIVALTDGELTLEDILPPQMAERLVNRGQRSAQPQRPPLLTLTSPPIKAECPPLLA